MESMAAFVDELIKISGVAEAAGAVGAAGKKAMPFLQRHGKSIGLLGAGAVGYHMGKKEVDKYMLGRQVYDQMQQR